MYYWAERALRPRMGWKGVDRWDDLQERGVPLWALVWMAPPASTERQLVF